MLTSVPAALAPVHPRVCGELIALPARPSTMAGSSPRVRGTPSHATPRHPQRRFIPACAGNSPRCWSARSRSAVHPRVCGELTASRRRCRRCFGSSPRVRGTRVVRADGQVGGRFIPACAGNSGIPRGSADRPSVHPRVCGELKRGRPSPPANAGSSPRVRGTRPMASTGLRRSRFIPACAGNSSSAAAKRTNLAGSSPRVRGTRAEVEDAPAALRFIPACAGNSPSSGACTSTGAGSSPRVRGTLWPPARRRTLGRFIPACAGNSRRTAGSTAPRPVHPRVCGELRSAESVGRAAGRFIPACAGNSSTSAATSAATTVHPRVCGELHAVLSIGTVDDGSSPRVRGTRRWWLFCPPCRAVHPRVCGELGALRGSSGGLRRFIPACAGNSRRWRRSPRGVFGSSPRVRGTQLQEAVRLEKLRFIPACAGNSSAAATSAFRSAVHPRVCGELGASCATTCAGCGSSPRVRGTPLRALGVRRQRRFIPACAGNSVRGEPVAPVARAVLPVHPRVCGELSCVPSASMCPSGSSPRVRGTPMRPSRGSTRCRFIPACAGNSSGSPLAAPACTGSSPRVRGTLHRRLARRRPGRFIPACAGNSSADRLSTIFRNGSSPRVRGTPDDGAVPSAEHRFIPACAGNSRHLARFAAQQDGSSPRVRGTRRGALGAGFRRRFIPACAGNSASLPGPGCSRPVHPRVCGELD